MYCGLYRSVPLLLPLRLLSVYHIILSQPIDAKWASCQLFLHFCHCEILHIKDQELCHCTAVEHDCSVVVLSSASYKPELRGRLRATSERSKKLGETSQVVDSMEYTCAACQRNFTNLSVRIEFASCAVNRNRKMSDHIYWSGSLGWASRGHCGSDKQWQCQ